MSTSFIDYAVIVMCHPPLIAHNPQRTADMASYIVREQDTRLQKIIDKNIIFLSGHTHVIPSIEIDEARGNLYINDGSICPTTEKSENGKIQSGNATLLERAIGTHKYAVQLSLCPLTSTYSVVFLFSQAIF